MSPIPIARLIDVGKHKLELLKSSAGFLLCRIHDHNISQMVIEKKKSPA